MSTIINEFKHIEMPQILSLGANMLDSLHVVIQKVKLGKSVLLITDKYLKNRIAKDVEQKLQDENYSVMTKAIDDSTLQEVEKQKDNVKEFKPTFIIGLGGGKPIDVAKYLSFEEDLRFISIPTICSHDGIASSRASLIGDNKRHSKTARPPIAVVADTIVLDHSPYRFTAAGCGDILAKKTAIKDWLLSHRLRNEPISEYSIALSEMTVKIITQNVDLIRSKAEGYSRIVVKALISSSLAMCVAGSSRPASGAEHMFSHLLDEIAEKPALHGEQCALGSIVMAYLHNLNWERLRYTLKKIGLPVTAKELGLKEEEVIEALTKAHKIRKNRFTILGTEGITHEAAIKAATKTGIIS